MKILCINGKGGSGKDTFVEFCGKRRDGIFNVSMIDGVKNLAAIAGWSGAKTLKDRKFLSDLKDLVAEYNDYPFVMTIEDIIFAEKTYAYYKWHDNLTNELICFIHAREPKDIERWRSDHGARAVLVRRPQVEGEFGNHADDNVFDCDYDYYIDNDGSLEELEEKAKHFIEQIREEDWESKV